jgi:nucleotide-binding universal stress UspA family protein
MNPRTILVAVDGSATAHRALMAASQLAGQFGSALHLVHVVDVMPALTPEALPSAEVYRQLKLDGQRVLDQALAALPQPSPGPRPPQTHLHLGRADHRIVQTAKDLKADLIVLGTHGRTGLARVLLGSVAEHVTRHAPCDVLTVRGTA